MRTVEDRLASLERSARRWKLATFCVAALACTAMMLGAQEKEPEAQEEVRAKRFTLVGPDGEPVGAWIADKDSAALGMQMGKQQVLLGILPGDGPSLDLRADKAKIGLLCSRAGPGIGVTNGDTDIKLVASPRLAAVNLKRGPTSLSLGAGDTDVTLAAKKRDGNYEGVLRKSGSITRPAAPAK